MGPGAPERLELELVPEADILSGSGAEVSIGFAVAPGRDGTASVGVSGEKESTVKFSFNSG